MLTQAKIDLAVLLKLFQHAEANGRAVRPHEICQLFRTEVPIRKVELALDILQSRGEVEKEYHPHHFEEGLWQITRAGTRTVEKALNLPNSFIARLHAEGDGWLKSEEASKAELSKKNRYLNEPIRKFSFPEPTETVSNETTIFEAVKLGPELGRHSVDWTKWGTIATVVGLPFSAFLAWYFT